MDSKSRGFVRLGAVLLLAGTALVAGCDKGGGGNTGLGHHPVAGVFSQYRYRLVGLDEEERSAIDTFIRQAGPRTTPFEVRRICRFMGKGLANAEPDMIADFVLAASEHLYSDFFMQLSEEGLGEVAAALRNKPGMGEVERFRVETIVRQSRGVYEGTLSRALALVSFSEAIAPRKRPVADLEPGDAGTAVQFTGAAEVLRLDPFVEEGAQPGRAIETYRRGISKYPDDLVMLAGLVCIYAENEETYPDGFPTLLEHAEEKDANNAVYSYLRAIRAFLVGNDELALECMRRAKEREHVTLYTLERAKRTAEYLEGIGYGPIRARLAAYRAASVAPLFDLKRLQDRAIRRSMEYQDMGKAEDLETVLYLPVVLERQFGKAECMLFSAYIRDKILASGFRRLADYYESRDKTATAKKMKGKSETISDRCTVLDEGEEMCGGQDAWSRYYELLGEERFLTYVDRVLFGNEPAFLLECAKADKLEDSVELTQREWAFE